MEGRTSEHQFSAIKLKMTLSSDSFSSSLFIF